MEVLSITQYWKRLQLLLGRAIAVHEYGIYLLSDLIYGKFSVFFVSHRSRDSGKISALVKLIKIGNVDTIISCAGFRLETGLNIHDHY